MGELLYQYEMETSKLLTPKRELVGSNKYLIYEHVMKWFELY